MVSSSGERDKELSVTAQRLGVPIDFLLESENFKLHVFDGAIYPENSDAVMVFGDCMTQWRVSHNGATGLDYSILPVVFDLREIKNRADVFDDLKVMERAALEQMRRK